MRKLKVFIFLLLIVLFSCEKDYQENSGVKVNEEIRQGTRIVSLEEIPEIKNYLKLDGGLKKSNNADDIENMIFDRKTIVESTDNIGNVNYSFSFIYEDTPENVFYNLIVNVDPKRKKTAYVFKYICSPEYFETFKLKNYSFDYFVGGAQMGVYGGDLTNLPRYKSGDDPCPKTYIPSANPGGTGPLPIPGDGGNGGGPADSPGSPGFNSVVVGYNYSAATNAGFSVTWGGNTSYAGGGTSSNNKPTNPLTPEGPAFFQYFKPWKKDAQSRVAMPKSNNDCPDETPPAGNVPINQAILQMQIVVKSIVLPKIQLLWLSANPDVLEDVYKFLGYNPDDQKKAFAEAAVESLFNGGDVDFEDKIILDKSFVDNVKAKCIFDKLRNFSAVNKALTPFEVNNPVARLKFTMGSLPAGVRAETSEPDENNIITITLNNNSTNDGVGYQPPLMVAQTIIHEIIHAEFFRQIMIAIGNGSYDADPVVIRDALANSEYTKLYEYFRAYKDWSHNYMADNYRRTIARVTQEYATGVPVVGIPDQFYTNLAWRGLTDYELVKAWKDLVDSNPSASGPAAQILNAISDYVTTNANKPCQ